MLECDGEVYYIVETYYPTPIRHYMSPIIGKSEWCTLCPPCEHSDVSQIDDLHLQSLLVIEECRFLSTCYPSDGDSIPILEVMLRYLEDDGFVDIIPCVGEIWEDVLFDWKSIFKIINDVKRDSTR